MSAGEACVYAPEILVMENDEVAYQTVNACPTLGLSTVQGSEFERFIHLPHHIQVLNLGNTKKEPIQAQVLPNVLIVTLLGSIT